MSLLDKKKLQKPKPFLKWVGGKTQLIKEISQLINDQFSTDLNFTYIEPFVGGGAVLFHILANFTNLNNLIINDLNLTLINAYQLIKKDYQELILLLSEIEQEFYNLNSLEEKKVFYLQKREHFNQIDDHLLPLEKTVLLLFLNKTCFNGLYRVNQKGKFNVPFGKYEKPTICNQNNLISVHHYLEKVTILQGDFQETLNYAKKSTLFYLDPPYKPINLTSAFNSYASTNFDDQEQIRLKLFCDQINDQGHYFILSNSDLKNFDQDNTFFDQLYQKYQIKRVKARRNINSKGDKRGELFELLITNF